MLAWFPEFEPGPIIGLFKYSYPAWSLATTLRPAPGNTSNLLINYYYKHLFCSRLTAILLQQFSGLRIYVINIRKAVLSLLFDKLFIFIKSGLSLFFLGSNFCVHLPFLSNIPVHYPGCQF